MQSYPDGANFPGRVGRTPAESVPAFPMPPSPREGSPNVVVVVLDDVGFGWSDVFGGLVETPAMRRLAEGGLRYTNFHTTAVCSPTRSCLLTGRNHHSNAMGAITEFATGFPGYNARQPADKAGLAAMLGAHGYTSIALGKWHNTPVEECGPAGPFNRWPTGPVFGFDHFYGFLGGDSNHWYPKLHRDQSPVDQPATPEEGYHLSEDLVDEAIRFVAGQESVEPDRPWHVYLAFGAGHAPHHVAPEWVAPYRGKFDMGWDRYRDIVLERQLSMGVVPESTRLSPMMDGIVSWGDLDEDRRRVFARMAEVFAGFLTHTDRQIGRLVQFLETTGTLDNTLFLVLTGDNGNSAEGGHDGLYSEMSILAGAKETVEHKLANLDNLGLPGSYSHYPAGWAMAGNVPFRLCKQYVHFGGTCNPLIVHWPEGVAARGEIRRQFHHVIDVVPTILQAVGMDAPPTINGVAQQPIEGVPMNYSFDAEDAPTTHPTQYFEMYGARAMVHQGWKAVTFSGRMPWEPQSAYASIDEQRWELYNLEEDPAEATDLVAGRDLADIEDPMVCKLNELVELWWADAGRYNVLPIDDTTIPRFSARAGLFSSAQQMTFYPGAVRIPESKAPDTKNRSWTLTAQIQVPEAGADGPICVMGGDSNGWSLYLNQNTPTFCYNWAGIEHTYLRSSQPLVVGGHEIRYEFEQTGSGLGAGGIGRLYVGRDLVASSEIARTTAYGFSWDETFDVGCDKGSPVTPEYPALAEFTGTIDRIDFHLAPTFAQDPHREAEAATKIAMLRE